MRGCSVNLRCRQCRSDDVCFCSWCEQGTHVVARDNRGEPALGQWTQCRVCAPSQSLWGIPGCCYSPETNCRWRFFLLPWVIEPLIRFVLEALPNLSFLGEYVRFLPFRSLNRIVSSSQIGNFVSSGGVSGSQALIEWAGIAGLSVLGLAILGTSGRCASVRIVGIIMNQLLTCAAVDLAGIGMRNWGVWRVGYGWAFLASGTNVALLPRVGEGWLIDDLILVSPTGTKAMGEILDEAMLVEIVNELCDLLSEDRNSPVPWFEGSDGATGSPRLRGRSGSDAKWMVVDLVVAPLGGLAAVLS